jgi:hypothetical protein
MQSGVEEGKPAGMASEVGADDSGEGPSDHPTDRLLRDLIRSPRAVTAAEVADIRARISAAPFNPHGVTTSELVRGRIYLGRTVRPWEESPFSHLVQRVLVQQQWADGTTIHEYLQDLHEAARDPAGAIFAGVLNGRPTVQVIAPNHIPTLRLGRGSRPWIAVIYSPNRGMLVSGYQVRRLRGVSGAWRLA